MDEKRRFALPAVGGSSLLVIFAVLCLTVFALLSLTTVQAGARLSDAGAQAAADYYAADSRAEEMYARLRQGERLEGVSRTGDVYCYTVPISDTLHLAVEVEQQGNSWTVLRWQSVSTASWQAEEYLDVWDGT